MNIKRLSLMSMLVAATLAVSASPAASGWDDDDDIYYNPASEPKQPKKPAVQSNYVPNTVVNYPGADTYAAPAGSGLKVDVDEYNRRGQFLVSTDTASTDTVGQDADTFAYTRRLERYYNPDIVNGSGDSDLINYYYATEPASDINVYVVNTWPTWPAYSSWYSPWYVSPWYWPSYSWSYYDPWYSWSWGWGPSWGPSWGWHPGPGWGPGPSWRPGPNHWASSAGSSRPHAPAGSSSTVGRRPGAISAGATGITGRPGYSDRRRHVGTTSPTNRPGTGSYTAPSVGGNSGSNYGSGSFNRGRNNGSNNGTGVQNNNTRRQTPSYNNNNYNSGSSNRGRSTYGTGGGSRSTHGTGGGSHSGGGGGGRGRR